MKSLLRNFLINLFSLWATTQILPGLSFEGSFKSLILGAALFMVINWLIVPLLRIMFLPLNLLTLGIFGWVVNVLALYFLTTVYPAFKLLPYNFPGANFGVLIIPPLALSLLQVAIIASFMIGLLTHFLSWLSKY